MIAAPRGRPLAAAGDRWRRARLGATVLLSDIADREGFLVALLSPLTIVFWMSVFGGYYAAATARGSRVPPVLLLAALMLGAAVWSSFSALLIHFSRRDLRERWYALLVTGVSLLLLVWALRLLFTGVRMLR